MTESMKLSILSPERRLLENALVDEVTLPTGEGQAQILPGHAPLLGTLQTGFFRYRTTKGETVVGVITTGFFEVKDNSIHVMAETLELSSEIDVGRARVAQTEAEETLKAADLDEAQFKKYQLKLQRSMIRQQLAGKDVPFV